jgi:hypothetical protein
MDVGASLPSAGAKLSPHNCLPVKFVWNGWNSALFGEDAVGPLH